MIKSLKIRFFIIIVTLVVAIFYVIPTFVDNLPKWWQKTFTTKKVRLGLDLRGGMHLILGVKVDKAVENEIDHISEDLMHRMRKERIYVDEMKRKGKTIYIVFYNAKSYDKFQDLIKKEYHQLILSPVEKVGKSPAVKITLDPKRVEEIKRYSIDQALETIRNRIDQFGVSEPDISTQGKNRILIQLPGVKDPQRAKKLIGKTALLEFKLIDEDHSLDEALKGKIPPGSEVLYQRIVDPVTGYEKKIPYLVKKKSLLTGDMLKTATVKIDPTTAEPYVALEFNSRGAKIFDQITGANVGKRLAIILDNNVHSAPVIRERISGGKAQITGGFDMKEARDLAIVLRAGALPAPVEILEERTVGPSLGKLSVQQGVRSVLIGGILVILFMIFYYKLSGIIADIALILNILFILAALSAFEATLTLPGIAGIVLTIGMAVDANILIFERVREELRGRNTPIAALDMGYSRAFLTIMDANITTLIAAAVLFQFGTGPIKGFAVTLSIGIIANLYTAIFVSRFIFDLITLKTRAIKLSI